MTPPLIAGAGPVGLAAALFLARGGTAVRLVDKAAGPRRNSRALAVNPRTLSLLEPTGVTDRLLAVGLKVRGGTIHAGGRVVAHVRFDAVPGRYPFLLAVSQSVTERLLAEAVVAAGGAVEREVEMVDCRPVDAGAAEAGVAVDLRHADGDVEHATAPWLLASDGAHGVARPALDLAMPGSTFARQWQLADVPLRTGLAEDHAHVFLLPGGRFLFCLRVVDDEQPTAGGPLWRVLGNLRDPVAHVPGAAPAGPAVWTSAFRVDHRIVESMQRGPIALAGDAAHVHSPVGARGMNLGIEDAWVFARLTLAGRQAEYGRLRLPVDRAVVRRVAAVSRAARGESAASRFARRFVLPKLAQVPAARRQFLATITGLDHPLPTV